eukprot:scaffold10671_cov131-Cylindrotheca_fusiformis.AAC.7
MSDAPGRNYLGVRSFLFKALYNVKQNVTPRLILKEAARALLLWSIVYLVLFGLLLGYKLQTKNYYEEKMKKGYPPKVSTTEPRVITLLQHESDLRSLIESYEQEQKEGTVELELLAEKQSLLYDIHEKIGSPVFFSNEKSKKVALVETPSFVDLLKRTSMSSMKDLESDFQEAINDIQRIDSSDSTVDWQALDETMRQTFPPKEASRNTVKCSLGGKRTVVPENAARLSDMDQMVQVIDRLLDKRKDFKAEHYPVEGDALLSSSQQTVHQWLTAKSRSLVSDIARTAQESNDTFIDDKCVDEELVLSLVEEGIEALQRKANLRNFLRKRAMELDPSAQSIILDADLPVVQPPIPEPDVLLLRRVLDSPIIFEFIDLIDKVVEASGGYNENLDQYLDAIAGSARASIGEIVIEKALEKSEQIEFPHPKLVAQNIAKKFVAK